MSDRHDFVSMNCKLVAEIPSQILTNMMHGSQDGDGDDHEATSCVTDVNDTAASLNNLCHDIIHNNLINDDQIGGSSVPFVTFIKAAHLQNNSKVDSGGDSNDACPLLGVNLPLQIMNFIDDPTQILDYNTKPMNDSETSMHSLGNSMTQVLLDVLPLIHPSLTQLQPCALLRDYSFRDYETDESRVSQNRGNILLLRIHIAEATQGHPPGELISEEIAILHAIIEEINGEAMVGATSNVIQALAISQIEFIPETEDFQSNEFDLSYQGSLNESMELPLCSVCRYRIAPERLGMPSLKPHQICTQAHDRHCNNMQYLALWENSTCEACQLLQKRLELSGAQPFRQSNQMNSLRRDIETKLKCYLCNIEETLWVCLTCGFVGCGRYSSGHAQQHFLEKKHPFSLELATQRIWDYERGSFVQREDLLNCPFMQQMLGAVNRAAYHGASFSGDTTQEGLEFGTTAKKTVMIGEQYEVLLQSALEDQAQYYEGEISRLQAELAAEILNKGNLSDSEMVEIATLERAIIDMRVKVDRDSRLLVETQAQEAGHRAQANSLLREQSILQKLSEKARNDLSNEEKAGQLQIEELEQQISDITSNIRMREQIANNDDLNQAQIYGTSGEPKQQKHGKRKGFRRGKKK